MKEQHQPAELEIIDISNVDIIQTSDHTTHPDDLYGPSTNTSSTQNPNCPNEGPAGDSWV